MVFSRLRSGLHEESEKIRSMQGEARLNNRIRVCRRCGSKVRKSDLEEYSYQCDECDEDLYEFETELVEETK